MPHDLAYYALDRHSHLLLSMNLRYYICSCVIVRFLGIKLVFAPVGILLGFKTSSLAVSPGSWVLIHPEPFLFPFFYLFL